VTAKEPLLLTPGPLTTSARTKEAMQRDWGSRDAAFIDLTLRIRRRLTALAQAEARHVCVPLGGSGTAAVEAMLGTLVPPDGRALVLVNGAYGRRIAEILNRAGRDFTVLESAENVPLDPSAAAEHMDADARVSDVVMVHCETTSGVLNPLAEISHEVARRKKRLLVDAMSSFGAIPIDARRVAFAGLAASSNKCLEGVPGLGFVLAHRAHLESCGGHCHSLSLDLHAQWQGFQSNGQWRFTPPTHVVAALDSALDQLDAEGGIGGRFARYWENCRTLVTGMRGMGFETYLPDDIQAPIIVTFRMPQDAAFDFAAFYDALAARGFVIYPGKLTKDDSFRIGCIGDIRATDIEDLLRAVESVIAEMGADMGVGAG
jgi:2-aminoethylphosphonate-pyruvate transaminase